MTDSRSFVTVRVSVISLLTFEFDCLADDADSPAAVQSRLDDLFPPHTGPYGFVADVSEPLRGGYVTLRYPIRAERVARATADFAEARS